MRDAPRSTRQEGLISESKRSSPRHERMPTSTKSTGVPRPVVSESRTTKSPSERRERAHRTASSRLPIRAGGTPVRVPLKLPIHGSSSHGASAVATHVSFRTSPQPRATIGEARGRCGRQRATSTSPTSATDPPKRRVAHPSDRWPRRSGANLAWMISYSMQDSEDFVCLPLANFRFSGFHEVRSEPLRMVAVLPILPAVLALEPLFEGRPVGVVIALEALAVGHGSTFEGLARSQLLFGNNRIVQDGIAEVGTGQVSAAQICPA